MVTNNAAVERLKKRVLEHIRNPSCVEADQWNREFYVRAKKMARGKVKLEVFRLISTETKTVEP